MGVLTPLETARNQDGRERKKNSQSATSLKIRVFMRKVDCRYVAHIFFFLRPLLAVDKYSFSLYNTPIRGSSTIFKKAPS